MKSITRYGIIVLLSIVSLGARAQLTTFKFDGYLKVMFAKQESKIDEKGQIIHKFYNTVAAEKAINEYKQAKKKANGGQVSFKDEGYVTTDENGYFVILDAIDGMCLVATYGNMEPQEIEIKKKGEHTHTFVFKDEGRLYGKGALGTAKARRMPSIPIGKSYECGNTKVFNLYFDVPSEFFSEDSRLFINPVAIDCQTEDTVDYLRGMVVDAAKYHKLQTRRMAYDYQNDPVNKAAIYKDLTEIPCPDRMYHIHYEITYTMPEKSHAYKCAGSCVMEDYTHPKYRVDGMFGSCNSNRPFRFFEWNLKAGKMPLTQEYYEAPHTELQKIEENLRLQFVQSKATLINTPKNDSLLNELVTRLKNKGSLLKIIHVTGYTSPEGSVRKNVELALERVAVAKDKVSKFISIPIHQDHKEYTWDDVVNVLKERKDTTRAAYVQRLINSKANVWQNVKDDSLITSILDDMRSMRVEYYYMDTEPLRPDVALSKFRSGENYPFNNGDYFGMLQLTENSDPKMFRALIDRAYQRIVVENKDYGRFATFIANRKACYSLEEENPDTTIVLPFLDKATTVKGPLMKYINAEQGIAVEKNNPNMVALICCMALKMQELDYANWWADKLPDDGSELRAQISRVRELINGVLHWGISTDEQKDSIKAIAREVMDNSPMNKAVLQTELREEFGVSRETAIASCLALPDNDPRKWYLLAMNCASKAGTTGDTGAWFNDYGTGFRPLSEDEQKQLSDSLYMEYSNKEEAYNNAKAKDEGVDVAAAQNDNGIPSFLGYLQHAFDMRPSFKRYYAYEALVDDKTRKKFPYNPYKAPEYRQKFESLQK